MQSLKQISTLSNRSEVQFLPLMAQEDHQSPPYLGQVLVIRPPPVFSVHEQYISSKFQILKAYESPLPTHDFLQTYAQSVKVVLCSGGSPITADVLHDLPALQLVVSSTTGVNHIDMAECRRREIRVTNTGDLFSDDVADGAVGLLIDVMRRISAGDRFVRGGRWPAISEYPLGSKVSNYYNVFFLKAQTFGNTLFEVLTLVFLLGSNIDHGLIFFFFLIYAT